MAQAQWVAIKSSYCNVYGIFHHIKYIWIAETNHQLALCLVHLVQEFPELFNLDTILVSTWKLFKYSSIKTSIQKVQEAINLESLKILKVCKTRWLTHRESCISIMSRYEALIVVLDHIYNKASDPETKGLRDLLLTP